MNDLTEIMVCEDVGLAELIFASDVPRPDRMPLSTFYSERARKIKPGLQTSIHMRTDKLRFMPGLLNQREKAMA